jgi:hypothetical protein
MNNGVLILAHNSEYVDYGRLSLISGSLAKRYLNVSVSLAADRHTLDWMNSNKDLQIAERVFDHIIEIPHKNENNFRILHDGESHKKIPFLNADRFTAYDITPYEKTLLIDSDFLIFSNQLNEYWSMNAPVMVSSGIIDIKGDRLRILDKKVSDTGIDMLWATTVMFDKSQESKCFFNTVNLIKENYRHYSDLYRFDHKSYRNDIAFSLALHMLNGFSLDSVPMLPKIVTFFDTDEIVSIIGNKITFLLDQEFLASISDQDFHAMNKQSILRNSEKFLSLI